MCKLIGIALFLSCLISTLTLGCSQNLGQPNENFSPQSENTGQKDKNRVCRFPSASVEVFERIWTDFSSQNGSEIANSQNFKFPEASMQEHYKKVDIEKWANCPVIAGDFNNDGIEDFLVMTVNNKINSDEKFSLIIFNGLKNQNDAAVKNSFSPKFVYQNRNLSKLYVSKARDGLSVYDYREDGSSAYCLIAWNKETQSYQCEN
jgi:hypothetical protein